MICEIAEAGGGILRMRARGELVFAAHPQFHSIIKALKTSDCRRAEFDLAQIGRMDMCGVSMLILAGECAAARGMALTFLNPSRELETILAISGKSLCGASAPSLQAA